jgi:hypothetical protein
VLIEDIRAGMDRTDAATHNAIVDENSHKNPRGDTPAPAKYLKER